LLQDGNVGPARSTIYSLLSRCFADHLVVDSGDVVATLSQAADPAVLAFLSSQPTASPVLAKLEELTEVLVGLGRDEAAELAAQREFVLLFLLPTGVQPYESVYRDPERMLKGTSWSEVRAFYRRCGLAVAEDEHHPEDHIASELAFMSLLSSGFAPETVDLRHEQRAFLQEHLLTWVPELVSRISQHPKADFYRRVGDLLSSWVECERGWLSDPDA